MASYAAIPGSAQDRGSRSASIASSRRSRHRKEIGFTGQASWLSSVINLVNTIVGAGVLAMPLAMSHMGIVLGTLVILWSGMTAGFGLYLQTRCARYLDRGTSSFFALSQITYPNAAVLFDAAISIKCFGVGVSYLIIIGDLMPGVVRGFSDIPSAGFLVDRHFWITAFMLIVIPLSFLRKLDSLKYTSIIALISIGYLVVLVVYHFASGDTIQERGQVRVVDWMGIVPTLASFPVIVFAYTCHQNMFSILNEIKDNSPRRTTAVVTASVGTSASIYILVALTGYLSFGDNVYGNIVRQYMPSIFSTIGKAAIVVLVIFSYPLQVHPCRASVDAVLRWRPRRSTSTSSAGASPVLGSPSRGSLLQPGATTAPRRTDMTETRFAAITTTIIILSYIVAMSVSSLERVLAYVGSTGSTSISFILPGLFYYKISSPDSPLHQKLIKEDDDGDDDFNDDDDHRAGAAHGWLESQAWLGKWRARNFQRLVIRRLSLALAVYGICVMVTCLISNTYFIAKK